MGKNRHADQTSNELVMYSVEKFTRGSETKAAGMSALRCAETPLTMRLGIAVLLPEITSLLVQIIVPSAYLTNSLLAFTPVNDAPGTPPD